MSALILSINRLQTIAVVTDHSERSAVQQMLGAAANGKDENAKNVSYLHSTPEADLLRVDFYQGLNWLFERQILPSSDRRPQQNLLLPSSGNGTAPTQSLSIYSLAMTHADQRASVKITDKVQRFHHDRERAVQSDNNPIAHFSISAGYRLITAIQEWTDDRNTPNDSSDDISCNPNQDETWSSDQYLFLVREGLLLDQHSLAATYRSLNNLMDSCPDAVVLIRIDQF